VPLEQILGIDHVVIAVRDLDAAAAGWRKLGFTVSPRGTHSAHMGSANYTIVFGEDYIELLGVLHETEHNRPLVAFLEKREGIERAAFKTRNAAAGVAELQARGIHAGGPLSFERPVDLPNGGKGAARFNILTWPAEEAPGGLGIFACEHLTPEMVWIPQLQSHANGAAGLRQIEIVSDVPGEDAAHMGRLIDRPVQKTEDGYRVSSGNHIGFLYYDAGQFEQRYPETIRRGTPAQGAVALVIGCSDLVKASAVQGTIKHNNAVIAPAKIANGVIISFVPA